MNKGHLWMVGCNIMIIIIFGSINYIFYTNPIRVELGIYGNQFCGLAYYCGMRYKIFNEN